jgi:hypothetical protein
VQPPQERLGGGARQRRQALCIQRRVDEPIDRLARYRFAHRLESPVAPRFLESTRTHQDRAAEQGDEGWRKVAVDRRLQSGHSHYPEPSSLLVATFHCLKLRSAI